MPRSVAFKDLNEEELFLTEDENSDLVPYQKRKDYGFPYGCWHSRYGGPYFYPAIGQQALPFEPNRFVYRLASKKEG